MNCQRCSSDRVIAVSAKSSDCCNVNFKGTNNDSGYAPGDMNIGGGDYIEFTLCLNCGQQQGKWPCPESEFEKATRLSETDPFKKGDFVEFTYNGQEAVGTVLEYDRDYNSVLVQIEGYWNGGNKNYPIVPIHSDSRFGGRGRRSEEFDGDEVKKTDKEW